MDNCTDRPDDLPGQRPWRKQASSDEWIEAFCKLVKDWKPREWAEEKGQIKAGVGPFLERMQRERQAYVYRREFPTRGDKSGQGTVDSRPDGAGRSLCSSECGMASGATI